MNEANMHWSCDGEMATRCGITKSACHEIGEIVWIELPSPGQDVKEGDLVAVVESTKAAFDIYATDSGKVVTVNEQLNSDLALLNHDPEGKGWLYELAKN